MGTARIALRYRAYAMTVRLLLATAVKRTGGRLTDRNVKAGSAPSNGAMLWFSLVVVALAALNLHWHQTVRMVSVLLEVRCLDLKSAKIVVYRHGCRLWTKEVIVLEMFFSELFLSPLGPALFSAHFACDEFRRA